MSVVILGFLTTFFCESLLCQGQSEHRTVVVEVTDPGGAGVPGAEVKVSPHHKMVLVRLKQPATKMKFKRDDPNSTESLEDLRLQFTSRSMSLPHF